MRLLLACIVASIFALLGGGPATAISPPTFDGPLPPLGGTPTPSEATERRSLCAAPTVVGRVRTSSAATLLGVSSAWAFSRGAGQTVAVIDTGVTPNPRLPRLRGGGDYVSTGDGLDDCDSHGTIVAGIIAATTTSADTYGGVAPDATIVSIRQSSGAFGTRASRNTDEPKVGGGVGSVRTLAAAVVRAVELGSTVINISEVACSDNARALNDGPLGAAVKFAYERNVVVVAAAGNVSDTGGCRTQNPAPVPGHRWDSVTTVASPAWFAPYVLTVGAVNSDTGDAVDFSLRGPWVSVAAPGTAIVGLSSLRHGPTLINALTSDDDPAPINGTSFAAPYVAGTAALVRARFPQLTAGEVMHRIVATAHAPGRGYDDQVGAGVIDPVAALTAELPNERQPRSESVSAYPLAPQPDPRPRRIALIGGTILAVAVACAYGLSLPKRRVRRLRPDEY